MTTHLYTHARFLPHLYTRTLLIAFHSTLLPRKPMSGLGVGGGVGCSQQPDSVTLKC